MFHGANCSGVQKIMYCWFVWQETGLHPLVDFIPLSAGVPPTALIGWRLESSCGSSGLNQCPYRNVSSKADRHYSLLLALSAAVVVYIPSSISYILLMGEIFYFYWGKKIR